MKTVADPYREWDVAYLLGSLSPAERREYERHLGRCAGCAREVTALAGLPGVLSVVPREQATGLLAEDGPVRPAKPPRPAHTRVRGWALFGVAVLAAIVLLARALRPPPPGAAGNRRSGGGAGLARTSR